VWSATIWSCTLRARRSRPELTGTGPDTRRRSERPDRTCRPASPAAGRRPGAPLSGVLAAEAASSLRLRRLQPHQPLHPALARRAGGHPGRLGHAPVADEHPRPSDQLLALLVRAATEGARPRWSVQYLSAPAPPRPRRLGGLVDDLVDPLVTQPQRLGDLPQRPAGGVQPADGVVIVHLGPLGGMLGGGPPWAPGTAPVRAGGAPALQGSRPGRRRCFGRRRCRQSPRSSPPRRWHSTASRSRYWAGEPQ